jgi:hypothetical protein
MTELLDQPVAPERRALHRLTIGKPGGSFTGGIVGQPETCPPRLGFRHGGRVRRRGGNRRGGSGTVFPRLADQESKWWDRPNIVLSDVRVSAESVISGRMTGGAPTHGFDHQVTETGWSVSVTVSNTGDAATTLLGVRWESDYESAGNPRTFVVGTTMGPPQLQMTDARAVDRV